MADQPDFKLLRKVGLTKTGIACYKSLLIDGHADGRQLAKRLKIPQTNLYVTLNQLVEQGFIDKVKLTTQPALFRALPLDQALPAHYMQLRRSLLPLCHQLNVLPPALAPKWYKYRKKVS